ncbi:MAG: phosphotransferase family protein [Sphingobium sp.]
MRDTDGIADALRRHLVAGASITGVDVLSAGHSNETYLVRGLDRILRLPPSSAPLLPLALGPSRQFDLFAILRGRDPALPIPAIDYMCDDAGILGAPFYLMERVGGIAWTDWGAPDWLGEHDAGFADAICAQAMASIAALHNMAPLDVLGPILDNGQELGRWRTLIAGADGIDAPDLHRLFDLLERDVPAMAVPAPCHGDPKLPNMLWRDGRLAAVLDWELAFNGDPRWDLAYMLIPMAGAVWDAQPGMDAPGLWRRDQFIARWRKDTGRDVQDIAWFDAANFAKIAAILVYGHHLYVSGQSADRRFENWSDAAAQYVACAIDIVANGRESALLIDQTS